MCQKSRGQPSEIHPISVSRHRVSEPQKRTARNYWMADTRPISWQIGGMCNLYRIKSARAEIASYFAAGDAWASEAEQTESVYPKGIAPIVRIDGGMRSLEAMRWGWPNRVPGKRIDKATGNPVMLEKQVTNVRNLDSPMWRSAIATPERRCLVPFTSFSEYGQQRGEDGKLPLHWFDIPSRPIAAFAGIWRPSEFGPIFAFLTTEPNSLVAPIHPKAMPVVLHDDDHDRWLTGSGDDARALAVPFPAQLMTVSRDEQSTR